MNSDESSRGVPNYMNRKQNPPKYGDKNQSYSPSSNFNYGNNSYNGNNSYSGNSSYNGQQQRPHRRPGFKRDNFNSNDRLIKQNDIIIRLLKEIRDRLPAPPVVETSDDEHMHDQDHDQDQRNDMEDHGEADEEDGAVLMESGEEQLSENAQNSFQEEDEHR